MKNVKANSYFKIGLNSLLLILSIIVIWTLFFSGYIFEEYTLNIYLGILSLMLIPFYSIYKIIESIKKIKIYNSDVRDKSLLKNEVIKRYLVEENIELIENIESRKRNKLYYGIFGSIMFVGGTVMLYLCLEDYPKYTPNINILISSLSTFLISIFFAFKIIYNNRKTKIEQILLQKNRLEIAKLSNDEENI
jgi:hypothetical protein